MVWGQALQFCLCLICSPLKLWNWFDHKYYSLAIYAVFLFACFSREEFHHNSKSFWLYSGFAGGHASAGHYSTTSLSGGQHLVVLPAAPLGKMGEVNRNVCFRCMNAEGFSLDGQPSYKQMKVCFATYILVSRCQWNAEKEANCSQSEIAYFISRDDQLKDVPRVFLQQSHGRPRDEFCIIL